MATQSFAFEGLDSAVASIRYSTDKFVAVSPSSASRLGEVFNIDQAQVCIDRNVQLLHCTDLWAWWSDNKLTTAIGLPDKLRPKYLSNDAIDLINRVCYSTQDQPSCGWAKLARVQQVLEEECIAKSMLEPAEKLKKLIIKYVNGERGILYSFFCTDVEDKERYFYEIDTVMPLELLKRSITSVDRLPVEAEIYKKTPMVAA